MNYMEMKKEYIKGWHTWNVHSVSSHVHLPDGLAINLAFKDMFGNYLKSTMLGGSGDEQNVVAGLHTFDSSYTELTLDWDGLKIRMESAVDGDDLLLLVTPVVKLTRPSMLVVETGYLWNRPGYTVLEDGMLRAYGKDAAVSIRCIGKPMKDLNVPVQTACLQLELEDVVAVYTGEERSMEQIRQKIEDARAAAQKKSEAYGELAEMYQALECIISWDSIYDPQYDRVISPVSRPWSINVGGYVLFCWDNYFVGFLAGLGDKCLAYSNLKEITNEAGNLRFVPNFSTARGEKSYDRSQPPVGSAMLLETYRRYREKWIVEEIYPALLEWNRWYRENRMNDSGALCWGSNPVEDPEVFTAGDSNGRYAAALESGLDNSPMYDDIPFNKATSRLELEDVGLTGLYILDCSCLIRLAREIGREEDIPELEQRLEHARRGLEGLWDEENGFYYNKRTDTREFSRRISPTNFYALFDTTMPEERQRRIADEHYYNPEEFYGEWMLPSIARNDPAYPEQDYWRGRIWAPMNFLVYLAVCGTTLTDVRKDLAEKSRKLFMKEWEEHRHVHENYNSITGEGCDVENSDKFHHWGTLLVVGAMAEAGFWPDFGQPLNE